MLFLNALLFIDSIFHVTSAQMVYSRLKRDETRFKGLFK